MHCLVCPLSSCDIKISVVSQCRILMLVEHAHCFSRFFSAENLHLLDYTVTWTLFMQTDAD